MYSPLVGINGNVLPYYQVMMYVQTNKEPRSESDVCNVVGDPLHQKSTKVMENEFMMHPLFFGTLNNKSMAVNYFHNWIAKWLPWSTQAWNCEVMKSMF